MEKQKLQERNPYRNESIEDILLALLYEEQYPDEYQDAFIEMHRRYMSFINAICQRACKFFNNGNELAIDLAGNVLLLACQNAIQFEVTSSCTEVEKDKKLKEWLVNIAKDELKRFTSHNPERKNYSSLDIIPIGITAQADDFDFNKGNVQIQEEGTYPISIESVTQVLESLKPRVKDIVMAYLTHVHRKNAHLPDEVMKELCYKYGTTPLNIRQIKKRAFDQIRNLNKGKA